MRMPFQNELNDAFVSDRSIWLKIGGSAFAAGLLAFVTIRRGRANAGSGAGELIAVAVTAAIGGCVGLALSLKDVVRSRRIAGKSVNPLLRLFFDKGIVSLLLWIVLAFGLAIGFSLLDAMTVSKKRRSSAAFVSGAVVAMNDDFKPTNHLANAPLDPILSCFRLVGLDAQKPGPKAG